MFLTPWIRTVKNRLSWAPWLRRHRRRLQAQRPSIFDRGVARRLRTEAETLEDRLLLTWTINFGTGADGQNLTLPAFGATPPSHI